MNRDIRIDAIVAVIAIFFMGNFGGVAWGQTTKGVSEPAKSAKCNRSNFSVILDVGHSVEDPGAMGARGVPEYEFNLRLAKDIEQKLIEMGFRKTLLLITGGPSVRSLVQRVSAANKTSANLLLSIHHDSVPEALIENWEYEGKPLRFSDRFAGHSIFVSNENQHSSESLAFAKILGRELKARGLKYTPHYTQPIMAGRRRVLLDADVGVYRFDELYVLRATHMPAVLLEAGSIINRDEELQMRTEERRLVVAASVVEAVEKYCALQSPRTRTRE